jgi:hypothetical protein
MPALEGLEISGAFRTFALPQRRSTQTRNKSSYDFAPALEVARKRCVSIGRRAVSAKIARQVYLGYPYGIADTLPPSTCRETPLMYEAAGESRKAAARPSSSGSP